jgi:hypothetical protein
MTLSSIKHGIFMLYYMSSNMRNPLKTKPDLIALIIWSGGLIAVTSAG